MVKSFWIYHTKDFFVKIPLWIYFHMNVSNKVFQPSVVLEMSLLLCSVWLSWHVGGRRRESQLALKNIGLNGDLQKYFLMLNYRKL